MSIFKDGLIRQGASGAADTGYTIDQSIRFNDNDSAYMHRTPSSGGNRDKLKRPDMLKKAIKYSSQVVFTSDNSRDEEFKEILKDASEGNNLDNVIAIEYRKEAIIHASKLLKDKDCLVILGKGHEEIQEENGKISFFSDHEVVNEIYK